MGLDFGRKGSEKSHKVSHQSQNYLVFKRVDEPFCRLDPFLASSAKRKSLLFKEMLAFDVHLINDAEGLVEHQVVEKIVEAKGEGGLGMALLAVRRVNEDSDADVRIDRVEVIKVEAADGCAAFGEVDHQAELLLAEQVVVIQQELLDLEVRKRHKRPADAPHGAVVLPAVDPLGIVRLGATERNRVVFDKHCVFFLGLARILMAKIRQNFRQNYDFWCNKG